MLPVVAIVGRPNVGKSTLFNALTGTRDALVADQPGVTRDRQHGVARAGPRAYVVVDTGGLGEDEAPLSRLVSAQVLRALRDCDVVVFVTDARDGLTALDERLAARLRRTGKPVLLVVNKAEGLPRENALLDFHGLGIGDPLAISAVHRQGLRALGDALVARFPAATDQDDVAPAGTRVAIVGRPNVGKSTLANRISSDERVVAHEQPGTTRDSIQIPVTRHGRHYVLIDTAGVRRRPRVAEAVEKFSVVKTLQAIEACDVVLLLLDAREGVTEQDASLLGHVLEAGRAMVIAVNKWDGLGTDARARVKSELERRLAFIDFVEFHFISALHGSGVGGLFNAIDTALESATRKLATPALTRVLRAALQEHAPPLHHGRRIKLRYAHQGGSNPPVVVVHGNQTEALPQAYRRYLERRFRTALALHGTPLRLEFRSGENPFAGRRNELTPRQRRARARVVRHARRR